MEAFSGTYRSPERLEPISVNFSVALSIGLMLAAGEIAPEYLSHKYLDANRDAIEAAASKVTIEHDSEMDALSTRTTDERGFSLGSVLSGKSLDGVSFENYVMAFPSTVTMRAGGKTYDSLVAVPRGAAGSDWSDTQALVHDKFVTNFAGDGARALDAIEHLEDVDDVRELTPLLSA
jgi:2-methylcitrate dehydratase PrpD